MTNLASGNTSDGDYEKGNLQKQTPKQHIRHSYFPILFGLPIYETGQYILLRV